MSNPGTEVAATEVSEGSRRPTLDRSHSEMMEELVGGPLRSNDVGRVNYASPREMSILSPLYFLYTAHFQRPVDRIRSLRQSAVHYIAGGAQHVADEVSGGVTDALQMARTRLAAEALGQFDTFVEKRRLFYVEDPSMPRCIKPAFASIWGSLSPHFRSEFSAMLEFEVGLRKRRGVEDHVPPPVPVGQRCGQRLRRRAAGWRAALLYALYPYDKSIWGAMQRPGWWVLTFFRSCPVFGANAICFGLLLAGIDTSDDYQLTRFILVYKYFQFWVSGIFGLFFAAATYAHCVVIELPESTAMCGRKGPGSSQVKLLGADFDWFVTMAAFFAQIGLVWIALFKLRFSVPKGGSVRRGERLVGDTVYWEEQRAKKIEAGPNNAEEGASGAQEGPGNEINSPIRKVTVTFLGKVMAYDRRSDSHTIELEADPKASRPVAGAEVQLQLHGRRYFVLGSKGPLHQLLVYDLVCFIVSIVGMVVFVFTARRNDGVLEAWQWRAALTGARISYSLSTLPFFLVSIPPWSYVITHARETGYNEHGICVPKIHPKDFGWVKVGMASKHHNPALV